MSPLPHRKSLLPALMATALLVGGAQPEAAAADAKGIAALPGPERALVPALPLTRIADIFRLPRAAVADRLPVDVEGVVTCTRPNGSFFLHDGAMGIYVFMSEAGRSLKAGDRVRVLGVSRPGIYSPSITPSDIAPLGTAPLPEPRRTTFDVIASGSTDSQWLEIEGVVWSVDRSGDRHYVMLELAMRGGHLRVLVRNPPAALPHHLVDAEVRLRGVATGNFNRQGQMVSPLLRLPDLSQVTVTRPAMADPFAEPLQPLGTLLGFSLDEIRLHRVRIHGEVTRQIAANAFFVRDETRSLRVETHQPATVKAGDRIEAAGFPAMAAGAAVLRSAVVRTVSSGAPPAALGADLPQLLDGALNSALVRLEARLLDWIGDGPQLTLILQRDGHLFKAILPLPAGGGEIALPEKSSRIEVTGICANAPPGDGRLRHVPAFTLLLAGPGDLRVVQRPPWWTPERLWRAVGVLGTVLIAGMGWVGALRRQVRRKRSVIEEQARHAALLEERSRIARELHDNLEQGLTGLSLQLSAVETDLKNVEHPAASRLAQAMRMLSQSRAISRNTIRELRSDAVPARPEGLVDGLRRMADLWNESGAIAVRLKVEPLHRSPAPAVEHNLLGIVTEAVTNAVKHGAAGNVKVELGRQRNAVVLRISDDGRGFDATEEICGDSGRYGLIGMHERARKIGGLLQIRSVPGRGTEISVELPDRAAGPSARATPVLGAAEYAKDA